MDEPLNFIKLLDKSILHATQMKGLNMLKKIL